MSETHVAARVSILEAAYVAARAYTTQMGAVAATELWHLRHDPTDLFTRAIQPALWLLLFGQVMARARGLDAERVNYLDFMAPGILAQSVLFASIFYGIAAIWERDLGVLHRYMVSPAPRSALVLGKAIGSAMRNMVQAVMIYVLCIVIGIHVDLHLMSIAAAAIFIALGSGLFSTFSLIVACLVRTRERFMGIGQLMTMPIFFASNAIYSIDLMPNWLKAISNANPLTYEVDALRSLMLTGGQSRIGIWTDLVVLCLVAAGLTVVATRLYPRMTE